MLSRHRKEPLAEISSYKNSILSKHNLSKKNKSIVDNDGTSMFQLSQQQIYFLNTEVNEAYEITMTIRNVSQNIKTIQIKKPKNPCLSLACSKEGVIAPGLQAKITIGYQNKNNENIIDKFKITSDQEFEVQVPIYVYPQASKLMMNPFINFGFIKVGKSKQITFPIQNIGTNTSSIRLKPSLPFGKLKLDPDQLQLEPNETKQIKITISSQQVGELDGVIDIQPKQLSVSSIDLVANFCEFVRMITDDEGNQLNQIALQPMFCGEKAKLNMHLVNNTPKPCQFRISRKKGITNEDQNHLVTPQQQGKEDAQKLLSFNPSQGQMQIYSSQQLKIDVQAKYEDNDLQMFCNFIAGKIKQFPQQYKEWSYTLTTHFNEDDQQLKLLLKGTSIIPKLSLSSTFLKFGSSTLNTNTEKVLFIKNLSTRSIIVKFQKSPNFKFLSEKIEISPQASKEVNVLFCPKIVGQISQIVSLKVGKFVFPFKLFGKGRFGKSPEVDTTKVQEINMEQLDHTFIQNQISQIGINKSLIDNTNNSIIHFEGFIKQPTFNSQLNLSKSKGASKKNKELKSLHHQFDSKQPVQEFSSIPKNQQEQRNINRQLSPNQLTNIPVGPVVIDIGQIFLKAKEVRYFHIYNSNDKPISIQLQTNSLVMFQNSSKIRQIMPAQSHGGLKILFEAMAEGNFKHQLQYILNGKHFFELLVVGRVIPPVLNFSKTQIKFIASQDDKNFSKTEVLTVSNNYNYPAKFSCKIPKQSLFKIVPQEGIVNPNQQYNIQIIHNFLSLPQPGGRVQENLKFSIINGKTQILRCLSIVPQCSCVCKSHEINFKQISIHKSYEQKIYLRNNGKNFTIFDVSLEREIQSIVSVICQNKYLSPDQTTQIIVKINSPKTTLIDSIITFIIRGGKPVVVNLKANAVIPKVRIQPQQIDFGSTPVQGNPSLKQIFLVNQSNIPVDLELRLQNDSFIQRCLKIKLKDAQSACTIQQKQSKQQKARIVSIKINPKSKTNFSLQFTPEEVKSYSFMLPIFLSNSTQFFADIQRALTCRGITNRLIASVKEVNFGKIIIEQSLETFQKFKTIELKNPQQEAIQWWVDDKNFYPFCLDTKKGKLEGNQTVTIKVNFFNDVPGQYYRDLHFFIDQADIDITQSYLKIAAKAQASYPQIYFSQPYIIMPVVNLNEKSVSSFSIINGGYQNINLKHVVVQQFSNIQLQVKYIQGSNLGVTKKKIDIQLEFMSDKPISFTIRIDFYDHNNRVFSLPVSGTADNCMFTFLDIYRQQQDEITKSCNFLKHYINNMVCSQDPLSDFPNSLCDDDYERFSNFLSFYSSSFDKLKPNWKKNNKVINSYEYFCSVIKTLKAEGAFLNQIRPQFLLNYKQYLDIIELNANNPNRMDNYSLPNEWDFFNQRNKSWLVLFYQIFKVYSRVPVKIKNIDFWSKFKARQKILISWLQQTYQTQADLQQPRKTHLDDLDDGQILSSVVSKYTNIKLLEFYGRLPKSVKQKEKRCKKICEAFNQIGINCYVRWEDILRSNPKQMMLLVERLYLVLPSYLQKGQPVQFVCSLGQCLTKSIQITNPSKYPVTYCAKIQGSKAYNIEGDEQFTIQSKKAYEVKIKYSSNLDVSKASATLTLAGKTVNKYTPSTFMFTLNSTILGRISEKNIQVHGQLYQPFDFSISVTNNFQSDGDFKISINKGQNNIPIAFHAQNHSIKVKKGCTTNLDMIFLPLSMDNQKCYIAFKDSNVGEFQYEINGLVSHPQYSQDVLRVPQILFTNKSYSIELSFPRKNDLMQKARKIVQTYKDYKADKKLSIRIGNQNDKTQQTLYPKLASRQSYSIKILPQTEMLTLRNDKLLLSDLEDQDNNLSKKDDCKIGLDINMKMPVRDATFIVFLKNTAGTDLRRYKVLITSVYKPLKYQLQLRTPVNGSIAQPLPLLNLTNENNLYRVNLVTSLSQDPHKTVFSVNCQREVQVKPREHQVVSLTFKPKAQINYTALLKIQNVTTEQLIEYQLIGIGQEPQSRLISFEQTVRQNKKYQIKIPYVKSQRWSIVSHGLEGAVYNKYFIQKYEHPNFSFHFNSKIAGKFQGKLNMQDQSKNTLAFKVLINVKDKIEGQVFIKTLERKKGEAEIALPVGLWSLTTQDNLITSKKDFQIKNNDEKYILEYYSTKPQNRSFQITFFNQSLGQFSYKVSIIVQEMPEIKYDPFKTQLGKIHQEIIVFQNTDNTPMTVVGTCSNQEVFFFQPKTIQVPPRSQFKGKIIHRPSTLQLQEGKIYFKSDKNSKWNYSLCGYGFLQTTQEIRTMIVQVDTEICQSITFINPFKRQIKLHIFLQNQAQDIFKVLVKNTKVDLNYLQQLTIPIRVNPREMKLYKGLLKLIVNEKIFWNYSLRCQTTSRKEDEIKSLKINSRIKKDMKLDFALDKYPKKEGNKQLNFEIFALEPKKAQQFAKYVKIQNNYQQTNLDKISIVLNMLSYKPFECPCKIQINDNDGCKWVYKYDITFLPPEIDDSFQIVSQINHTSSVVFRLTNKTKQFSKFKAYFTSNSGMEFSVSPKIGDLQPYDRDGTKFQVSFAPTQYRNGWHGKLIIETQDSYWSYDVKGCLKHYNPPVGVSQIGKTLRD